MAEDRGIEPYGRLKSIANDTNVYAALQRLFLEADARYNSGLFHMREGDKESRDTLTPGLRVGKTKLKRILDSLYYPKSPYEFSVLASDTLGQVYEQFLGKTIRLQNKKAIIEEKPAVRKAGGVYYTPNYIVEYIVKSTIGPLLIGKRPQDIGATEKSRSLPLRIVDPACGSGSFLLEAYQFMLDWYREQYVSQNTKRLSRGINPKL